MAFNIQGPLIGVPLMFGDIVVGVMVVWSNRSPEVRVAEPDDIPRLEPFARLAVTTIRDREMDRERTQVLQEIDLVLASMRGKTDRDQILLAVIKALTERDLDRARVFEYDPSREAFVCRASAGVEPEGTYVGVTLSIMESTYARRTSDIKLHESGAEIRNPLLSGPDPNSARLGKPPDLEWAVSALWVGGHLFGYIAGDNKITRRPITSKVLDSMNIFGGLAALAIANLPPAN